MPSKSINCALTTMGSIISRFDLQGVHFNFTLSTQGNRFKSIYGGLFTIITYLIGGLYFGYLIYMWKTYQLQPTITRNSLISFVGHQLMFDYQIFKIQFYSLKDFEDDRQLEKINALLRIGSLYKAEVLTASRSKTYDLNDFVASSNCGSNYDRDYNDNFQLFPQVCQNLNSQCTMKNLSIDENKVATAGSVGLYSHEILYSIYYCDPKSYDDCLNRSLQSSLQTDLEYWTVSTIYQKYNANTRRITYFEKSFEISSSPSTHQCVQLNVQKTKVNVDEGIIFPSIKTFDIISDIEIRREQCNYPENIQLLVSLDSEFEEMNVVHPKFTEILAMAGSWFQLLFPLRFLITWINHKLMISTINQSLVNIYFPQFVKLTNATKRGVKNTRASSDLKHEQLKQNEFFKKFTIAVDSQLNLFTLLNQLQTLQQTLQLLLPRKHLLLMHDMCYSISDTEDHVQSSPQANQVHQKRVLTEKDYFSISKPLRSNAKHSYEHDPGENIMNDFFNLLEESLLANNRHRFDEKTQRQNAYHRQVLITLDS